MGGGSTAHGAEAGGMSALTMKGVDLPTLAVEINAEHEAAENALNMALHHARRCGELLIEAKGQCEHGEWGRWLADNFRASERTARGYMTLARRWHELPTQNGNALPIREALAALANPRPEQEVVNAVDDMALEREIAEAEDDADATLWEQAERVVATLDAGMTQRDLASQWVNARTGNPYDEQHVRNVVIVWRECGDLNPRPRFRGAYNEVARRNMADADAALEAAVTAKLEQMRDLVLAFDERTDRFRADLEKLGHRRLTRAEAEQWLALAAMSDEEFRAHAKAEVRQRSA
jgi:hypothetical protein